MAEKQKGTQCRGRSSRTKRSPRLISVLACAARCSGICTAFCAFCRNALNIHEEIVNLVGLVPRLGRTPCSKSVSCLAHLRTLTLLFTLRQNTRILVHHASRREAWASRKLSCTRSSNVRKHSLSRHKTTIELLLILACRVFQRP